MPLNFLNNGYFAGTVGIGTNSPDAKVEISQASNGSQYEALRLTNTADSANMGAYISWHDSYAVDQMQLVSQRDGAGNGNIFTFNQRISGVSSPALVIKNGKVGINAISPAAKLEVSTTGFDVGKFTGNTDGGAGYVAAVVEIESNSNGRGRGVYLTHRDSTDTTDSEWYSGVPYTGTGYTIGNAPYGTSVNSDTGPAVLAQSRFFIQKDGKVGIGETSPSSKLDVVGANSGSIPLVELTASGTGTFQRGVRLLNGGMNVGDSIMYAIGYADNSKNMGQTYFYYAGSGSTSNRISIGLHGVNDVLNVLGTGNVGIGITGPTAKLQVAGTTTYNSDTIQALRVCDATDVSKGIHIGFDTTENAGIIQAGDFGVVYKNLSLNPNAGNVGIGELDPDRKLHVNSGSENANTIFESTDTAVTIRLKDLTGSAEIESRNDFRFSNNAGADQRMVIGATGAIKFNSYGAGVLVTDASGNITATTSPPVDGITFNNGATITNQINTDVDTGTETIASVAIATHDSAFFDFVIKKGLNVRSGTVYACHDGDTTPLVAFTETSTQDLGDTSDVTLSVVISGTNMELQATTTSDNWSVKSLIRAI